MPSSKKYPVRPSGFELQVGDLIQYTDDCFEDRCETGIVVSSVPDRKHMFRVWWFDTKEWTHEHSHMVGFEFTKLCPGSSAG